MNEEEASRGLEMEAAKESLKEGGGAASDYFFDAAYRKGYFKALLDARNFWESREAAVKAWRLTSYKGVLLILNKLLEERDELREKGWMMEMRVSRGDFERFKVRDVGRERMEKRKREAEAGGACPPQKKEGLKYADYLEDIKREIER
jgi:hypothetical protein